MHLYGLPVLLLDLFTFTWWENLLDQFLHRVVVHRVCVDVTAELVEVPALGTQTDTNTGGPEDSEQTGKMQKASGRTSKVSADE